MVYNIRKFMQVVFLVPKESIRGLSFFFKKTQTSNPLDLEVFDI